MTLPDLPCRELVELVTEHLEGTLDPVTEARVREHLAVCADCADHVEQLRTVTGLLASMTDDALPPRLRAGLLETFRARLR